MSQCYTDATFEFFMAITFNNNMDFFHANHEWYMRSVRKPSLRLAERLSDTILSIDENLETRPDRVLSRINRDLRFSGNKTPYRDYIWLSWHQQEASEIRLGKPSFYFELSCDHAAWGMGIYLHNKPLCNAFRLKMLEAPGQVSRIVTPIQDVFLIEAAPYKRMRIPEGLPPELEKLYPLRTLDVYRRTTDFALIKSGLLYKSLAEDFRRAAPLYKLLTGLSPIDDEEFQKRARV